MLAWAMVTCHMLIWFIKWGLDGNLLHNMFSLHESVPPIHNLMRAPN
jgi:hypothetical protein